MSTLLALEAAVATVLGTLGLGVATDLISDEVKAGLRSLARRLVQRSASRVPAELQNRYDEEWGAEVEHIIQSGRTLKALKFAVDLRLRGVRGIATVARRQRLAEPTGGAPASVEPSTPSTPLITLHPELTPSPPAVPRDVRRIHRDLEVVRRELPRIQREVPPIERNAPRSGWKWG